MTVLQNAKNYVVILLVLAKSKMLLMRKYDIYPSEMYIHMYNYVYYIHVLMYI